MSEIDDINVIMRLYNAPIEVGFISEEVIKAAGTFHPHWKNHDSCPVYLKCKWIRGEDFEYETFNSIEDARKRALGIVKHRTHYFEGKGEAHG